MSITIKEFDKNSIPHIKLFEKRKHKGENGKVLVIGGSSLFHTPIIWAAQLISRFVDLVFIYSPNAATQPALYELKQCLKNGILVPESQLHLYIEEADVVLVGPGMMRRSKKIYNKGAVFFDNNGFDEGLETKKLVNILLSKYSNKNWVIDAGALQEVDVSLIPKSAILTPHAAELKRLFPSFNIGRVYSEKDLCEYIKNKAHATWLIKYKGLDYAVSKDGRMCYVIKNGNEGLTKGGTGDVLSALTAAFYTKNPALISCVSASFVLKYTADRLYAKTGPYYSVKDIINTIPKVVWELQTKR